MAEHNNVNVELSIITLFDSQYNTYVLYSPLKKKKKKMVEKATMESKTEATM